MQEHYGFSPNIPRSADFVNYTNEDIGFIASLVAGTNDVYGFALPYPATLDLFDETIVVHALEGIYHDVGSLKVSTVARALNIHLAMLDRAFGVSWFSLLGDAEDEAFKAQFAGPMFMGDKGLNITAVAAAEGSYRESDSNSHIMYIPPVPLDLVTPLFVQISNASLAITLATNAAAENDFTAFEVVAFRVWFTRRNLSSEERQARNMSIRFQRLDS